MSTTNFTLSNPIGARVILDVDVDETPELDLRGGATTLYRVRIDNTANTAASYVKFYDQTTVTLGTSVPFMILKAKAGVVTKVAILGGLAFGTGLSVAAVTAGGTGGTTGPTGAVLLRLHTA